MFMYLRYLLAEIIVSKHITNTMPSFSGTISAQNIRENSVQRAVFSHIMHKMDF